MTEAAPQVGWDPRQYLRYADERRRPLDDLLARVGAVQPGLIIDLGCGPGPTTVAIAERWPTARVIGVDNSPEMIADAAAHAVPGRIEFEVGDVRSYQPAAPVDAVVANAVFQWVPGHLDLLPAVAGWLAPDGWLALQVPDNFTEPSHLALAELRRSPRWRERLGADADRSAGVEPAAGYLSALLDAGLDADVWQTTYLHRLTGDDPVLEWMKGTALRPVLSRLADDPTATETFLEELRPMLRAAYPAGPHGTVLPFRRTFVVGHRPA